MCRHIQFFSPSFAPVPYFQHAYAAFLEREDIIDIKEKKCVRVLSGSGETFSVKDGYDGQ